MSDIASNGNGRAILTVNRAVEPLTVTRERALVMLDRQLAAYYYAQYAGDDPSWSLDDLPGQEWND